MRDSIHWASECMAQGAGVIIEPISLPKEFLRAENNRLTIEPNYIKNHCIQKSMIGQESVKSNCPGEWGWGITNNRSSC